MLPYPNQMRNMLSNPGAAMSNMMMQQLQSNPLYQRAMQMAQGKSPEQLQQVAQNLCQQKGIDINQAYAVFQQQFGQMNNR